MIASLSVILLCQLIAEIVVHFLALPVPGPVLGMLLLFGLLLLRDRAQALAVGPLRPDGVDRAAKGMLAHLSLLFVPAGVGVVQKLDLLAEHGVAISIILAISVLVTLLATVGTFVLVNRLLGRRDGTAP